MNKLLSALKAVGIDVGGTISRFADNDEMYVKFLLRYPDEDKITPVKEAYAENDCEKLRQAAHRLKGVSINLGMTSLAETAGRIESKAASGNLGGLDAEISKASEEYSVICRTISENS